MRRVLPVAVLVHLCSFHTTLGQAFYRDCVSNTGAGASIILLDSAPPTADGKPVPAGSELAVFTPDGLCAGVLVWQGSSAALSVWEDDSQTPEKDGFAPGESVSYRIWDSGAETELGADGGSVTISYHDDEAYLRTDGTYATDAVYTLVELSFVSPPPPPPPAPAAPVLAAPADGAVNRPTTLMLKWEPVERADAYRVQVADNDGFENPGINLDQVEATFQQLTDLSSGTTYYWRIRAVSGDGKSAWSQVRSFSTRAEPTPPTAPALVAPADGAADLSTPVMLSWASVEGAESYRLQLADNDTFGAPVLNKGGLSDTSRKVADLGLGTTYFWRVRAVNGGGNGKWSTVRTFSVEEPSGTAANDEEAPDEFRLYQNYPNPFNPSTTIRFTLPQPSHVTLTVFSALGTEVSTLVSRTLPAGTHSVQWNPQNAASGVYLYRLRAEGTVLERTLLYLK